MAGLITPEAVVLDFDTAGIPSRLLARVVDLGIAATIVGTALSLLTPFVASDAAAAQALVLLVGFLSVFGYPAIAETWTGSSPGKTLFGLRVITVDGGPVGFRHAAIRSALQAVDFLLVPLGVVAVLSVLTSRLDQRLGDRVAGTLVVRTASLSMRSRAVGFPPLPGLEGYTAALDVSGLSAERYEVLRSFLIRVNELDAVARQRLALRLAEPTAGLVGSPPPSMHPEVYLASVAAAYQQRHGGPATWMWGRRA